MSGRLACGANQRPLAGARETECDKSQPPPKLKTPARSALNNEVMKLDSEHSRISARKERSASSCQFNDAQHSLLKSSLGKDREEEEPHEPSDQVVPDWPVRPDTAQARRDSVMAGDEKIQYKICSLKDYSQVSSMEQPSEPLAAGPKSGHSEPVAKQLVKSLSQDRKMICPQAKRMSECIYTPNSRPIPAAAADEVSSSTKLTADSATVARANRPHQLGTESKIDRVRKLFVAPLSLRPASSKQPATRRQHNQISVASSSSDLLPGTSKQQRLRSPVRQKGAGKSFQVYGCPLHLANNIYPITCFGRADIYKQQSVPYILARLCNYIEENSSQLTHEGIFRVNGNARLMGKLRTLFDHLGDAPLESESVDVATSASMLKMYLRELPEPLIPARMNYYFITLAKKYSLCLNTANATDRTGDACDTTQPSLASGQEVNRATGAGASLPGGAQATSGARRNSAVRERQNSAFSRDLIKLVRKLPIENYNLLKYLACFLHRVSLKQEHNKMCAEALGIVFGPNVFRVRSESFKGLKEQELSNKIMSSIISNYRCIFDSELTDPLGNLVKEVCSSDGSGGPDVSQLAVADAANCPTRPYSSRQEFLQDDTTRLAPDAPPGAPLESTRNAQENPDTNLSSGPTLGEPPSEPPDDTDKQPVQSRRNAEADQEDEDEESYTISSGSESYCSSEFSHSLTSSYDDEQNNEDDDAEDEEELELEDEEELGEGGNRTGVGGGKRSYRLNRKHISSSECPSDTSYTPTSSHSDNADEEDWAAESLVVGGGGGEGRRGSCAACTCRDSAHPLTSSTVSAKSIGSKNVLICDKVVSSSASAESRRLSRRCPAVVSQVQRESSRKGRPLAGPAPAPTTNTLINPTAAPAAQESSTANREAPVAEPSAGSQAAAAASSRRPHQMLGLLLRRRSSSASSLSRVRRQSRQRLSSREEQRLRLQKTRIRRARARGAHPVASKKLAAIQQRGPRNHIVDDTPLARCMSGSDRSYLAGDEVSSVAHTDEPESLIALVPQVAASAAHLRPFNSDENLLGSVSGGVGAAGSGRKLGSDSRSSRSSRSKHHTKGSRLSGLSGSTQRGLSGHTSADEPGELMQCSLVSLLGFPNPACGSAADTSCPSINNMNDAAGPVFGVRPDEAGGTTADLYSWREQSGEDGANSVFRAGVDSLLSQMRANKALTRQLKRLIRHARTLGGFSHQMELLVGRIQPQQVHQQHQADQEEQHNNNAPATTMCWQVDYLSTLHAASEIEHQLSQWTQASSARAEPAPASEPSDNFARLAGSLAACISKLNRRHESLRAICEHNLRNHSTTGSHQQHQERATGSGATLASSWQLSSSEPSLCGAGSSPDHDNKPPGASEPSLAVAQSEAEPALAQQEPEDAREATGACCFGPLCPAEFVCKIEGQLAAKRRRAGRMVALLEMSAGQLAGEKLELQKNLLRYEHWFERPVDKLHIGLVGHLYERYRAVKQLQRAAGQQQHTLATPGHTTPARHPANG